MQKILIIEDDIIQSKQIINYISKHNEDIKFYNIAYTYQEAIDIIKNEEVDIIILDLKLPDISGIEILKYIQQNNIKKYINSILIVSGFIEAISEINKNPYIYSYIAKPYKLEDIQKNIYAMVEIKKINNIMNRINTELKYLHFNFAYNGTRYLAESILEIYCQKDNYSDNLQKDIYPIIAKKHNKTANTIHGDIKQATKCMYFDCEEDIINKYFNYNYFVKPKVKEIIFTILNKI